MQRTTIMLPVKLKARAARSARRRGISLGELIRDALEASVSRQPRGPDAEDDAFWADRLVSDAVVPADLSSDHDRYLYGDL